MRDGRATCGACDAPKSKGGRTAHALAEARGFVAIAELISYCGEQAAKNQSSFFDVLARAANPETADTTSSFARQKKASRVASHVWKATFAT